MITFNGHFYFADREKRMWRMKIDENADYELLGTIGHGGYIFAMPYNY